MWPGKTSLYIQIVGLTNPDIASTGLFSTYTKYDGLLID